MLQNKRGFTLIEVIGVITVLSLLLLITMPALTKTLKKNEKQQYNDYITNLKMATETYIVKNIDSYPQLKDMSSEVYIEIDLLLKNGYIENIIKDPELADDEQPDHVLVTLNTDGTFNYSVVLKEKE